MKRLIQAALGGRPMTFIRYAFTDQVTGQQVNYYADKFGREWLATNRWGWFRVLPCGFSAYGNEVKEENASRYILKKRQH